MDGIQDLASRILFRVVPPPLDPQGGENIVTAITIVSGSFVCRNSHYSPLAPEHAGTYPDILCGP